MMMPINQAVLTKELIGECSESLIAKTLEHSGLVDAYDTYDVLLNYWADIMQDDCYMISNDGWTYPEVKAIKVKEVNEKKHKKDTGSDTESNKSKTKEMSEYESEVNGYLAEMGFTL